MSRRKTITRNELVGLAREKRSALGMNRGQSRDESIGGDESNIDVVNRQHLLSQGMVEHINLNYLFHYYLLGCIYYDYDIL